jgi:hypothetical protein
VEDPAADGLVGQLAEEDLDHTRVRRLAAKILL